MKAFKYALKHINKWRMAFIIIILGIITAQTFTALTSVKFKEFIDALNSDNTTVELLVNIIIAYLVLDMIAWIGYRISEFVGDTYFPKVMASLRTEAFNYLHRHSFRFFSNNFSGSLVKKINRYVDGFHNGAEKIIYDLIHTTARVCVSLIILYTVDPDFLIIAGAWVILFMIFNFFISKYKYTLDLKLNKQESTLSGYHADTITNQYNISLFTSLSFERGIFSKLLSTWKKLASRSWIMGDIANSAQALLMVGLNGVILLYGIRLWDMGELSVGDFVLIQSMLIGIFGHLWNMGRIMRNIARSVSDMTEMVDILEIEHEVKDIDNASKLEVENGEIEFKNLTFGYNDNRNIFDNFNLKIEADKKIALVSKSGQGKSTLVKLLLRFFNVPENSVFIDGQDIMKVTQDSLRSNISLVPQDPVLFHRSLSENIAYARPKSTMEEILDASKKSHCHEFITELKDGYDTFVGERGIKLSGGERQRVAIARAFIEDAPILILDEATSSLDSESEHLIQDALTELMKNKTVIVIAHRLSTIRMMDEILILESGQIVERGTHEELVNSKTSKYKKLWEIQAGGFLSES